MRKLKLTRGLAAHIRKEIQKFFDFRASVDIGIRRDDNDDVTPNARAWSDEADLEDLVALHKLSAWFRPTGGIDYVGGKVVLDAYVYSSGGVYGRELENNAEVTIVDDKLYSIEVDNDLVRY